MVVLALETVTRAGSVALSLDGRILARAGDAARMHGERLPTELLAWLDAQSLTLADVTSLAVVSGPGSFTGIRVGLAAMQGLAFATGRGIVPVSTLDAIAGGWVSTSPGDGWLVACVDGQRGEVFIALYDTRGATTEADCRVVVAPMVATPADAARHLTALLDARSLAIVGDGAVKYADLWREAFPRATVGDVVEPLAASTARIAAAHPDRRVAPHAVKPVYLRRPDAELARERAGIIVSTPRFEIVRATSRDDLSGVDRLQRDTFTNPWGAEAMQWELMHTDVARLYLMRDAAGALVAYCACWLVFDELHINSLAVGESHRRQGLARRLLRHVFAEASGEGARSATLEVRGTNAAARGLYEGLGFSVEGVRRDYYQQPREDALILWNRDLPASLLVRS